MPGETLGTIRGQLVLDVKQALAAYTSARQAHISTVTALQTGGGALVTSGAMLAGVGVAMAAGIMVAVDAAAKFEKRLDFFAAVSNSTQKQYDAVRDKALQLGADTIYSANQIADSFVELGKAGISAEDIINGVGEAVAYLGAAADIPLDTAANIITSAVQTFGLSADHAVGVADKLAGAANASIVDVTDLGTSLKYAGGVAASLGIPFEDVNTALALLGTYGIKGSTAGTSLRKMMLSLGGATPKATGALKDLGIILDDGSNKFFTAEGKAKPLAEIFQILQDATQGLTDKQKVSVLNTIFQNRALASAIGLTKSGAAGFAEMAAAIDKTTAADVAGKRLDNLSGDIEILKGNIDTLLISGGSSFQEFARGIIQGITNVIQGFIDLPKSAQGTILMVMAVVAAIFIVIGGLGLFAGSILNIIGLSMRMMDAFGLIKAGLLAVKGALVKTAIAQWILNSAIIANPITWIIVGIVALVAALIWFFTQTKLGKEIWSNFIGWLVQAWKNIVNVASTVWSAVTKFFSEAVTNILNWVKAHWGILLSLFIGPMGMVIQWVVEHWGEIVKFFQQVWTNITTGISNFITGAIGFFKALPGKILAFFMALPGMIGYALGFLLGMVLRYWIMIGQWLLTNVPLIITNVVNFFMGLPDKIFGFFNAIFVMIVAWGVSILAWAMVEIPNFINSVVTFFQELPGRILQFFLELVVGAVKWLLSMRDQAVNTAQNLRDGIINWIKQVPGQVIGFFIDVRNNVVRFFSEARDKAIEIGSNIFKGIRDALLGLPGLVKDIFHNVVTAIRNAIGAAVKAVTSFASGLWQGFKDGLGIHSPSYIEKAMWQITGVMSDETERMKGQVKTLQGLGNGITEIGDHVGDGFGANLTSGVSSLYGQLAKMNEIQASVALNATSIGVDRNQANMDKIADAIQILSEKDTITVEQLTVEDSTPTPVDESLPRAIRKMAAVIG